MDKVSVIIPTYNRSYYLTQSIESALAQDYPNLEVIVSDDASTDDTPQIEKKYGFDSRFKYFRNSKNLGMAPNWRKSVFEYATGEWALILGDDDYFIDNCFITKAMQLAAQDKDIVLVHANCRIFDQKNNGFKDTKKKLPKIVDGKWMFTNYVGAIKGDVNFDLLTVIFNRKAAREVDIFKDNFLSVDREGFLKMSLKGQVGFINDVVGVYRLHGSNLIYNLSDMNTFFENLRAVTGPYEYAKQLGVFNEKQLERWKRKMIREYVEIKLIGHLQSEKGKVKFLKNFAKRLITEYPFSLIVLFKLLKPKVLLKILGVDILVKSLIKTFGYGKRTQDRHI